jgi:hypothetical protein
MYTECRVSKGRSRAVIWSTVFFEVSSNCSNRPPFVPEIYGVLCNYILIVCTLYMADSW